MELVVADIGGTHARFAIATIKGRQVQALGKPVTLRTADHTGIELAWKHFGRVLGRALPRAAAIAVASPIESDVIKLTNSPWVIRPALIEQQLLVDRCLLINDFGAVGHAVANVPAEQFQHVCGPDVALPTEGVISICGPGTGLGVAQVLRTAGDYGVIETEGGHIGYAPFDAVEDALVQRLRARFARVSAERVCAGPAIVAWYETLAAIEGRSGPAPDDQAIWAAALDGSDPLAVAARERLCQSLGGVTGDLALAHGAKAVVIAGGLGLRLKDHLISSGFAERFAAKGRFQGRMAALPVKLLTHPQPGLFGAAAAFAHRFG